MPITVIARLDDETAAARTEWLAKGLPGLTSPGSPLHVRLATYGDDADVAALDAALRRTIRPWTQISVTLVGFGIFPGQPSDVWLLPVPIHRLLQMHMEVDAGLLTAAGRHSDEFGIWMPTVGLGQTACDSDCVEVLVSLYNGPIDVLLDRIELVRTSPFEIISSRTLPG